MAGMLTNVGVRTWTRFGFLEFSFQETLYMTSPRGASTRLVAVPVMKLNLLPSPPEASSPGGSLVRAWRRILQLSMISRARAGGGASGEDGDNGFHHAALQGLDHGEDGSRVFDVAVDAADAVHGVVDAIAGDGLEYVHDLLANLEAGHEH